MTRSRRASGFTLIELMIVVAIIGILAAIAIPNFIRFQAKSKQSEVKSNMKALFTAQRSYFQEKDKYTECICENGFSPERNNRYSYITGDGAGSTTTDNAGAAVACSAWEARNVTNVPPCASQPAKYAIEVDIQKYTTMVAQPACGAPAAPVWNADPNSPVDVAGIPGLTETDCPNCTFAGLSCGDIDNDATLDVWWVAGEDALVGVNAVPAGTPYNTQDDVTQ
ncbi:MAG: prepilin-type N-terminal cleavage/methylation domain-containing protein [Myxococcota bacterium]